MRESFLAERDPLVWNFGPTSNQAARLAAEAIGNLAGDSYLIYDWAYDREPPSNIYAVLDPGVRTLFTAIHMAGPELMPASFDYGGGDVALIWWDPDAEGTDELGQVGQGMYRFANGGQRYTLEDMPTSADDAGLFDTGASVVELTDLPPEDRSPDYPSPDI